MRIAGHPAQAGTGASEPWQAWGPGAQWQLPPLGGRGIADWRSRRAPGPSEGAADRDRRIEAVNEMTLKTRAILKSVLLLAMLAALLFVPAGTLRFWQAWVFLAVVAGATVDSAKTT